MTKAEQWKKLRDPMVQRAWTARKKSHEADASYGLIAAGVKQVGMTEALRLFNEANDAAQEHYRASKALEEARAAQRRGDDPLIWKLAHGGQV